jgi:C1A family cysteine protease
VIGLAVRLGFDTLGKQTGPNGVDDDITSASRGNHALLAVGYNQSGVLVENSWGSSWANGGFGRVSWRVVQHDIDEAHTIDGFAKDLATVTPGSIGAPSA